MRSALGGLLAIVVLAGCGDSTAPATDLRYASWKMGCSMVDGPETWITLAPYNLDSAQASFPYVQINISKELAQVGGPWMVGSPDVTIYYAPSAAGYQTARFGHVTILDVATDSTIHGAFNLQFPSRAVVGEFWAGWSHQVLLCA